MGIEGLRALAATAVLASHVPDSAPLEHPFTFGRLGTDVLFLLGSGVTLFFILSGFLLFLPFAAAALRAEDRPSFSSYFQNRALRIFPAYWFVLLASALVLQSVVVESDPRTTGAMDNPGLLLHNLLLIQNYDPSTLITGIQPAWSLVIELVFYLALPVLVLAGLMLARRTTTRGQRVLALLFPATLMAAIGVSSLILGPQYTQDLNSWRAVWYFSFLTHAHLFAPGLALAVIRVEYEDGRIRLPHRWRPAAAASAAAITVAVLWLFGEDRVPAATASALLALTFGVLVALVVLPPTHSRSPLVSALERPGIVTAGLISYSVFLWHSPVLFWLRAHGLTFGGGIGAFAADFAIIAPVTALISWLTYTYVERPALRHKARSRAEPRQRAPIPERA